MVESLIITLLFTKEPKAFFLIIGSICQPHTLIRNRNILVGKILEQINIGINNTKANKNNFKG